MFHSSCRAVEYTASSAGRPGWQVRRNFRKAFTMSTMSPVWVVEMVPAPGGSKFL